MRFPEPYLFAKTVEDLINWGSTLVRALESDRLDIRKRAVLHDTKGDARVEGRLKVADSVSTPENGMIRYNSTTNKFQGYAGGVWTDFH